MAGKTSDYRRPIMIKAGMDTVHFVDVRYRSGDTLGSALATSSLLPYAIIIVLLTMIHLRAEFHTILVIVGLVFNDIITALMKRLFAAPRPSSCVYLDNCDSYGLPSQHASFMVFLAVLLHLLARARRSRGCGFNVLDLNATAIHALKALAAAVIYSRVYLGYHTWGQVIAGSLFGSILGYGWAQLVEQLCAAVAMEGYLSYLGIKETLFAKGGQK